MQSKPAKESFIDLAKQAGEMGREDCQDGWQHLLSRLIWSEVTLGRMQFGNVLDVGSGLGKVKNRIPNCVTQDPAPVGADTRIQVDQIQSDSFDVVSAFDVIEHVVEDLTFLEDLVRIARRWVFLTTPNLEVSNAANGCHCREYSPSEFAALFSEYRVIFFTGNGRGTDVDMAIASRTVFVTHKSPHQAALLVKEIKS